MAELCNACQSYHGAGQCLAADGHEGVKYDDGKPRWSLVPHEVYDALLGVLEYGARKYEPDNWRRVPNARERYYDALMRHVHAWRKGERDDQESGLPHLWHALACVAFLVVFDGCEGGRCDSGQ